MEQQKALPPEIEEAFSEILAMPPEEAAPLMAAVVHRAAANLHGLSNRQAKHRKGQPDWVKWARLANAARAAVLQTSACRNAAKDL